jgi:hypothetical protein
MKMPSVSVYFIYKLSFFILRRNKIYAIAILYFTLFVFCTGWNTGSTSAVKWDQSEKDMKERVHFLVATGFSNLEFNMHRKDGNFRKILPVFLLSYTE